MGLERTIFTVFEDVGVVELCARVFEPAINRPIEFPFGVTLFTTDRTAGIQLYNVLMLRTLIHSYSESDGLHCPFYDLDI